MPKFWVFKVKSSDLNCVFNLVVTLMWCRSHSHLNPSVARLSAVFSPLASVTFARPPSERPRAAAKCYALALHRAVKTVDLALFYSSLALGLVVEAVAVAENSGTLELTS